MIKIIHKDIYSNRIKTKGEIDCYNYEIQGELVTNSFMIFLCKSEYKELMIKSLYDFCETKRDFTTSYIQNCIMKDDEYNDYYLDNDLNGLFQFETIDILDFLDICINILKYQVKDCKETFEAYQTNRNKMAYLYEVNFKESFINSLNEVFQLNNLGYEVINDIISSKQSDFLHVEAIKKPLTLLINEEFNGPLNEFKNAIDKYTHKNYEDTIIEACKAFESTMKSVLDKLGVQYNHDKPPAKALIGLLKDNGIFDSFQENNLNNITVLLLGLPTIRNRKAGHGDGIDTNEVERSYASLALNLAGSYIVFILDRYYEIIQ